MTTDQVAVIAFVVALAIVVIARFEMLCLRDLAARDDAELNYLSRTGWALVIGFVIPVGGIVYLCRGRRP